MSDEQDDDLDDFERYLDPELQREIDQLSAKLAAILPPRARLAPDLEALEIAIANVRIFRNAHVEDVEPYMFGRFEAIDTRRGGMGLVIHARDTQLDREVAIKLWMRSGPDAQDALLAEAKTLAKLKHPNVVAIYEPGVWNERVYFVMEWIEGVDGHEWMNEPRSWGVVRDVFIAAGTGLAAAHDAGIQHRDFKPSNMLVGNDGRVVVADFGVADSLHAIPEPEESGRIPGTPCYMAPERLRGEGGDARSDQFSFCVAMWRALFGLRPYAGHTGDELLEAIARGDLRETDGVEVPAWLRAVVRRGLAEEPDQRFRDMHELVRALRDEPPNEVESDEREGGEVVSGDDPRVLHRPGEAPAQAPWGLMLLGMLLGGLLVLAGVAYVRETHERARATEEPAEPAPKTAQPCAVDTLTHPEELNPIVEQACQLIRLDRYDLADALWERERSVRRGDETVDDDTLIVARTFLDQAESIQRRRPEDARLAALHAFAWAQRAAAGLDGTGQAAVRDVQARAKLIASAVPADG